MTENDGPGPGPGRPASSQPLKRWIDYIDAIRTVRPVARLGTGELYAWLRQRRGYAVHASIESFRRVLNGVRPAKTGFARALAEALELEGMGLEPGDLEADLSAFKAKLAATAEAPSLMATLERGADGTTIALSPKRPDVARRHFGPTPPGPIVLDAGVTYAMEIKRPVDAKGVSGPLCLLGYGYLDRCWQMVSAVTDQPLSPTTKVQWGRVTGISMTPNTAQGHFLLYAVGATGVLPTCFASIFERCRQTGGFLSVHDVDTIQDAIDHLVRLDEAWTSSLQYVVWT